MMGKKYYDSLKLCELVLENQFIETGELDIPKITEANLAVGHKYYDETLAFNPVIEIDLIDWKSKFHWKEEAMNNLDDITYQRKCMEKILSIDPKDEEALNLLRELNQNE